MTYVAISMGVTVLIFVGFIVWDLIRGRTRIKSFEEMGAAEAAINKIEVEMKKELNKIRKENDDYYKSKWGKKVNKYS